ncbi:MAG TPA: T9SS type A sorting domain-containing protein [Bacteroidetes bacterium]|nr:T9SS type A sorting domain-containing protein [Bacteroidota bacterium]
MKPSFKYILALISLTPLTSSSQDLYPYGDKFPLALYALYTDFATASNNQWNCGHSYHYLPTVPSYYDSCSQNNLYVMARLSRIDSISQKWPQPTDTTIKEIQNQAAESNISWWDLPEEMRYWKTGEMQIVQDYPSLTRAHDPLQRPNYMYIPGHYQATAIENYVQYLDILPASCYTRYQKQPHAYTRWSIERTKEAIASQGYTLGKDYLNNEKTVMAILEIFETDSPLTEEGTWHDFWMSIACDVKGIVVFSHYYRDKSPTLTEAWDTLNDAVSLFKSSRLDKVILEGSSHALNMNIISGPMKTPEFVVVNSTDTIQFEAIKLFAKDWNDTTYLITLNSSNSEVVYTVEDTSEVITYAQDLKSGSLLNFSGSSFTDTLKPLGVSLYKLHYDITSALSERTTQYADITFKPNPFNRSTIITFPNKKAEPHRLEVFDILGNRLRVKNNITTGKLCLKKGELPPGTYIIELCSETQTFTSIPSKAQLKTSLKRTYICVF